MGHGYLLPTVCFNGDDAEGERAERIATEAGYQVRQVSRTWYTRDGERCGPFWELQFVMGAACRAPIERITNPVVKTSRLAAGGRELRAKIAELKSQVK